MNDAASYLGRLGGSSGSALESAGGGPELGVGRIGRSLDALEQVASRHGIDPERKRRLLDDAARGLGKLASDGAHCELSADEQMGLEAVILTDGSRPVLFVRDDSVELDRSILGEWHDETQMLLDRIGSATRSVGRIDDPAAPQKFSGTGFVIDHGVIATNRHVLEEIADGSLERNGVWSWRIHPDVEINFGHEFERNGKRGYAIERVLFAGPEAIRHELHLDRLDLAILQCAVDDDFPPAIALADPASTVAADDKIYVLGYPARPLREDANVLTDLFADTFGFKRWAPGRIQSGPGELDGDSRAWIAAHDASTLGGNSGSAIFSFGGAGDTCVALHVAGAARARNYAHVIARIRDELGMR